MLMWKTLKFLKRTIYIVKKSIGFTPEKSFIRQGGIIGENCEIFEDVMFGSEPYLIKIGNNVRISYGVKFATHDGGVWVLRNKYESLKEADVFGEIVIGNNVNIGWNVIILPGVHVGNNCVIGAGSVVTKNIPDNSVAAGVPARVIETIEEYKEKTINKCDYIKSLKPEEKKKYLLKK